VRGAEAGSWGPYLLCKNFLVQTTRVRIIFQIGCWQSGKRVVELKNGNTVVEYFPNTVSVIAAFTKGVAYTPVLYNAKVWRSATSGCRMM